MPVLLSPGTMTVATSAANRSKFGLREAEKFFRHATGSLWLLSAKVIVRITQAFPLLAQQNFSGLFLPAVTLPTT